MPDSKATPYRRRRGRGLLYALLLAVIAGGVYWYYKQDSAGPRGAGDRVSAATGMRGMLGGNVPVRAATAGMRVMDHTLRAIGTVTAYNTVTVRSRVDGELQEITFADGQKVEAGDVLARIDPRSYQVQLDQALGQQAQNQAQLKNAEQDLQRYQQLYRQKSIAKQQLDTQAALAEQLRAVSKSNQAAVDNARLQLSFTEITAPISGRLGLRQVDVGNLISAGSTDGLVVITQIQPISVNFSLPQADLPEVLSAMRSGRSLPVDVYGADDTTVLDQGELAAIDNQIDVATGTVSFKARVPNQDETLFPNQFVNVRLHVGTGESLAIPTTAVQYGSIGAFVYVIDDQNVVHIKEIVPGRIDGRFIAVTAGLAPGERVVTEGIDRLREGATVEIIEETEPMPVNDTATASPGVGANQGH